MKILGARPGFKFAAIFAALLAPMLMAPTGGFPSRPKFTAVGIGGPAPTHQGNINMVAAPADFAQLQVNGSGGGQVALCTSNVLGICQTGVAAADSVMYFTNMLHLSNGTADFLRVNKTAGAEVLDIVGTATGAAADAFIGFVDSAGLRIGYVGDGSGGNSDVVLGCDTASCNVNLSPNGGQVQTNGVDITSSTGTFTWTGVGFTAGPTTTMHYHKIGTLVMLWQTTGWSGTSNTTSFVATGMPAAIEPATIKRVPCTGFTDNSVSLFDGSCIVSPSGGGTSFSKANGGVWTAAGAKGAQNLSLVYDTAS